MPRRRIVLALLAAPLLVTSCTASVPGRPVAGPVPATTETPAPPAAPTVACEYVVRGQSPAGKATRPSPDAEATGSVRLTVGTDGGELELELDAASAPCSVHSFRSLADQGFFDGTSCHRLTTVGLFVLQCGDATGTGQGTPGYAFDDPAAVPGEYRRGVVAMANASAPGTNGSQFFIVHRDSELAPEYPIVGRVAKGMDVVDVVASAGVVPGSGLGEGDGRPVRPLTITSTEEG
ncbi:peptidylprolyl isomerase [Saccharothrix longispora]|uniref:Peptidyl-prolyl cis-trans isomerase B (Cyclophilin B) n=1 Tax=Saccharothrix longispora TaxID=33920 RepID=A0ABU1PMZ1_9PSEU|nr:peptidylprolyl isomerase [Saccharothrix longispora]MDR6592032.1 peptidyl-prolyl cis-trans isomerase B (cyclophilin B) [Saccharothrix longispora]